MNNKLLVLKCVAVSNRNTHQHGNEVVTKKQEVNIVVGFEWPLHCECMNATITNFISFDEFSPKLLVIVKGFDWSIVWDPCIHLD